MALDLAFDLITIRRNTRSTAIAPALFVLSLPITPNVEVTDAARLYRVASLLTAGLGSAKDLMIIKFFAPKEPESVCPSSGSSTPSRSCASSDDLSL